MKIFLFIAGELKWINGMKDRTWTDGGISRYKYIHQCYRILMAGKGRLTIIYLPFLWTDFRTNMDGTLRYPGRPCSFELPNDM
jgi:hypothetical protein